MLFAISLVLLHRRCGIGLQNMQRTADGEAKLPRIKPHARRCGFGVVQMKLWPGTTYFVPMNRRHPLRCDQPAQGSNISYKKGEGIQT